MRPSDEAAGEQTVTFANFGVERSRKGLVSRRVAGPEPTGVGEFFMGHLRSEMPMLDRTGPLYPPEFPP